MLGQKQARVKIEWGKSTTSAILRAVRFQADKDTQIAARGCLGEARWATAPLMKGVSLSDTAGSGQTDWQIGVAAGTTELGSSCSSLNTDDPPWRLLELLPGASCVYSADTIRNKGVSPSMLNEKREREMQTPGRETTHICYQCL